MISSKNWCLMKKGGVDSHNIHTALYSACIFALIFIFSDLIKQELDKKNLDDKTSMFISFFIHFFLIIIVTWFVIFIFKTIYKFGDDFFKCK